MAKVAHLELVGAVAGDFPLIPPGKYLVGFERIETAMMFGRQPKIILTFRVAEGEHLGVRLQAFYNARQLVGKPGLRGNFKVGRSSDYLFDFVRLHGAPSRMDRLSTRVWNGVYTVSVRTVKRRSGGAELPECLQYSVVDQIVQKDAGAS